MAEYSINYMESHCIDVFFYCLGREIHVLTDGNHIPSFLNDRDRNRTIQQATARLIGSAIRLENIRINQGYISLIRDYATEANPLPEYEILLGMFLPMAQLGFYSYDCIETYNDGRGRYHLVASPDSRCDVCLLKIKANLPYFDYINILDTDGDIIVEFEM